MVNGARNNLRVDLFSESMIESGSRCSRQWQGWGSGKGAFTSRVGYQLVFVLHFGSGSESGSTGSGTKTQPLPHPCSSHLACSQWHGNEAITQKPARERACVRACVRPRVFSRASIMCARVHVRRSRVSTMLQGYSRQLICSIKTLFKN